MILVRQVFQAKYGRGDELVVLLKELRGILPRGRDLRILTDASGRFFTVVTENEVDSLADWEQSFKESMGKREMGDWFARMVPLVESGSREFYTIVD